MNQAHYFIKVNTIIALFFGGLFSFILLFLNPANGSWTKVGFMLTLSIFVWSTFGLILFFWKKKKTNNELLFMSIKSSFRQSFFLALFLLGVLSLAAIRLLTWWDLLLLGFSFILLELYFKSNRVEK